MCATTAKKTKGTSPTKREKILHRFYEPLVLLHALNMVQGDRVRRQSKDASFLDDASRSEHRRHFLDSLAYACDYEKGGDTTTAMSISSNPLIYHIACNQHISENSKTLPFLKSILHQLRSPVDHSAEARERMLSQCVVFSEQRIATYKAFLQTAWTRCMEVSMNRNLNESLRAMEADLLNPLGSLTELCRRCFALRQSPDFDVIKEKALEGEHYGNERNAFAEVKHFVGRLASHVQLVQVLLATARRFPDLFEDFQIEVVNGPPRISLSLPPRKETTLYGMATRMVSHDVELTNDLKERLEFLDRNFDMERVVLERYSEKSLKPRVHAEMILLEYHYQHNDSISFYGGDRFIGVSKPACYCCSLYFREHPGDFVQPATHQKIYLNWLSPTHPSDSQDYDSPTDIRGRAMLNVMVKSIRNKLIEQLKMQTGGHRRRPQYDSITWDTFPKGSIYTDGNKPAPFSVAIEELETGDRVEEMPVSSRPQLLNTSSEESESSHEGKDSGLSSLLAEKLLFAGEGSDDDEDGGVLL